MHRNWHYFWRQYVYPRLRRKPKCRANWNCHSGAYRVISRPLDMAAGQEKKRNQSMKRIIMKDISLHKQSPYRKCNKRRTIFAICRQTEICPICYGKLELWAGPVKEKRAIQPKPSDSQSGMPQIKIRRIKTGVKGN